MARRLTEIEKRVYANQTLQLEQSRATAAARVVATARQELLSMSGGPNANSKRVLKNLDRALAGFDKRLVDSLKLEGLIESGYKQGRQLLFEVSEGDTLAVIPMLDLNTLSVPVSNAVNKISGIGEQLKARIKTAVEVSLALGEGEQQTMSRLMGQGVPGQMKTSAPFRATKIQAERISRTVTNELVNEGKRVSYNHFARANAHLETWVEWVVVSDVRTSPTCRALEGQRVKSGESFSGGGFTGTAPPAHINCRSTIIPVLVRPSRSNRRAAPTLQPVVTPVAPAPVAPVAKLPPRPKMTKGRFPLPIYPDLGLSIERIDARGADYGRYDEETIRVNGLAGVPENVSNSRLFEARRVAKVANIKPSDADTFDLMTAIEQARPVTLKSQGEYSEQVNSDLSRIYAASTHKQRLAWSKEFTSNPNNYKGEASRAIAEDLARISRAVEDAQNRKGEARARRAEEKAQRAAEEAKRKAEARKAEEAKKAAESYKLTKREQELKDKLIPDLKFIHEGNDKELGRLSRWEAAFDEAAASQNKFKDRARLTKAPKPAFTSTVDGHKIRAMADGGGKLPHDISFTVDGSYAPRSNEPKLAKKIASEAQKLLDQLIDSLPEGSILSNAPLGGPLSTRAMIYSRKGFGPATKHYTQYALKVNGKLVPLIDDLTDPTNGAMPNGVLTSYPNMPDFVGDTSLQDFLGDTTLDDLFDGF